MLRKNLALITVLGLALTVAGCAPTSSPVIEGPKPTPTKTAEPIIKYGDSIPFEEVTDELGTYQHTTIDPESEVMKDDLNIIQANVKEQGFTEEQAFAAKKWVLKFVAEQVADSIAIDRDMKGWEEWVNTESDKWIEPTWRNDILKPVDGNDRSKVIFADLNNRSPVLIRDGKPRILDTKFSVNAIYGLEFEGTKYLSVAGTSKVNYRVTDETVIEQEVANGSSPDKADVVNGAPWLEDGKENKYLRTLDWQFSVFDNADGTFRVAGFEYFDGTYGYGEIK